MKIFIGRNRVLFLALFAVFLLSGAAAFAVEDVKLKTVAVISSGEELGKLKEPNGLYYDDAKQRLYIVDSINKRLVSLDDKFRYLSELSHPNILLPTSVVKASDGSFFVVDSERGEIMAINIAEKKVETLELKGLQPAKEKFFPGRLAISATEELYVIDRMNKRILRIARNGAVIGQITVEEEGLTGFSDVRLDEAGNLYAVDSVSASVYLFDAKGVFIRKFSGKTKDGGGKLAFPVSLAVSKSGNIYVLDRHSGRISVFDKFGALQYNLSRQGVRDGELYNPVYIFLDKAGHIYTIDSSRIQVFSEVR